jgi:hypothetical protein
MTTLAILLLCLLVLVPRAAARPIELRRNRRR